MKRVEAIKILQHCGAENYCHHYIETGWCYRCNRREALDMSIEALSADTISREEAIHAIDLCRERKNKEIDELRTKWLEAEQKADKPTGVWVDKGKYSECSECGEVAQKVEFYDGVHERLTNYCPACGARMLRGDDEE